jgi:hypothetical protein
MDNKFKIIFALIIFIFGILLSINSVQAEKVDTQYLAAVERPYNITVSCDLNGWFCPPATTICNSTVVYPNTTPVINNQRAILEGANVIVPLTSSQLIVKGDYLGNLKCQESSSGLNSSYDFVLRVNQIGSEISIVQGILYGLFILIMIVITFLFTYAAISIPIEYPRDNEGYITGRNQLKYIKLFCIGMSYFLIAGLMGMFWQMSAVFFDSVLGWQNAFRFVFLAMMYLGIIFYFFLFILGLGFAIKDAKLKKLVNLKIK